MFRQFEDFDRLKDEHERYKQHSLKLIDEQMQEMATQL